MSHIKIKINERFYDVACDDGQEERLTTLAGFVEKRVNELVAAVGQIGEAKLLLMAGLLIADELSDIQEDLLSKGSNALSPDMARDAEIQLAKSIGNMADKIETIAERIEEI